MASPREFRPVVKPRAAALVVAVLLGLVLAAGFVALLLVATRSGRVSYTVGPTHLVVDSGSRLDGVRELPLSSVREARVVALRGARRVFGTGMPGLCTGKWSFDEIGSVWLAGDCSSRGVLIRTTGEAAVVVTPPDPERFVRALEARTAERIELAAPESALFRIVPGAFAAVMAVSTALLTALLLFAPRRMRYVVGNGALEVHTLFSRSKWPASTLRVRRHAPAVTLRVMGTAFPGYYTGRFRADGQPTRIYATDLRDGVLVEGAHRVFLSPADVSGFLAALRAEGAMVE